MKALPTEPANSQGQGPFHSGERPWKGIFLSRRRVLIFLVVLAGVASVAVAVGVFRDRRSPEERGTGALVKAFAHRRLIEARLSGGFKAGAFNGSRDDRSNIDEGELQKARDLIQDSAASGRPQAMLAYGRLLLLEGRNQDALSELRIGARNLPYDPSVHNDLGVCFQEFGNLEDALDEFDAALAIQQQMPEALFNRALCYQQMHLRDAALVEFTCAAASEHDKGWLAEIEERRTAVSTLPKPKVAYAEVTRSFEEAASTGEVDQASTIAARNFEWLRYHALVDLTRGYLETASAGSPGENDRALSLIDLIGKMFVELRGDRSIADLAAYLRGLPSEERQSELELINQYIKLYKEVDNGLKPETQAQIAQLKELMHNRGNVLFESLCTMQTAICQYKGNRFGESIDTLRPLLLTARSNGWHYEETRILLQLGVTFSRLGQDSMAIRQYAAADEMCRGMNELQTKIEQYLGFAYWHLGNLDSALPYLRRSNAVALAEGPGAAGEHLYYGNLAYNYLNIADIYQRRGRHALAILYAKQSISFSKLANENNFLPETLSLIAVEQARLTDFSASEESLSEANAQLVKLQRDARRFPTTLVAVRGGEVAAQRGDLETAKARYSEAVTEARSEQGDQALLINALRGRAMAYAKSGLTRAAESDLSDAIGIIENYRSNISKPADRATFLEASQSVFDDAIAFNADELGNARAAFELAERARARSLLDDIEYRRQVNSHTDIAAEGAKATRPLSLAEIQAKITENLTLVQYAVTRNGTYVFLVTQSGLDVRKSPATTEQIDQLVSRYLSDIKRQAPIEELNENGRLLYKYLIDPATDLLKPGRALCIVPDKSLSFLPLASLVDPANKYLIESYALTYSPSASVLARSFETAAMKPHAQNEKILAVGDPTFDQKEFPNLQPLSDAGREARQISRLYGDGSILLTGKEATERNLRTGIEGCDVVHLASHCLVDEKSPWLARLVVAPSSDRSVDREGGQSSVEAADPDDGSLYLREIYGLNLRRTRLVVLSACQSALGQYYRGEGIVSLVRPFIAAGVPTVVASLWPVESQATADFMIAFHEKRTESNCETAEALRAAQIGMARSSIHQHPYYWAAFITVGK